MGDNNASTSGAVLPSVLYCKIFSLIRVSTGRLVSPLEYHELWYNKNRTIPCSKHLLRLLSRRWNLMPLLEHKLQWTIPWLERTPWLFLSFFLFFPAWNFPRGYTNKPKTSYYLLSFVVISASLSELVLMEHWSNPGHFAQLGLCLVLPVESKHKDYYTFLFGFDTKTGILS